MELVEPSGADLEDLRARDPAEYAWIDELPEVHYIGQLVQLLAKHGKEAKLISITMPRRKPFGREPIVMKPK